MARINQVGPGQMTSGTVGGLTYVKGKDGRTYVRSTPIMPAKVYESPAAKKRQALFKMIQTHLRHHLPTLRQTFVQEGTGSPSNGYFKRNNKVLSDEDIKELTNLPIEILLVTGGYDHGNRTTLLANCEKLAASSIHVPIVFAGNCDIAQDVRRMLTFAGKEFYIVPNILPAVGKVNSKPVEEIIRNLFLSRIVNMQ